MNKPSIMAKVLIAAGVLGTLGTLVIALTMLGGVFGIPAVAGFIAYLLGFALLLVLTQNAASLTPMVWLLRIIIPLPVAIALFFATSALGL